MRSPSILVPMAAIAVVGGHCQVAQALNATEVSAIAKKITVRIDGQNPGSGVLLKRQGNTYTVLTAAHVVATEDEYELISFDDQRHPLSYSRVQKLPDVDLALVEFNSSKSYPVADLGDSAQVEAGASIYVSGFPIPTAAITEAIWTFSSGQVTANASRPLADGYSLVYSNNTLPGMSGGAVLDHQGKLIGIHGRADSQQQVKRTETVYVKTGFNLGISIQTFLGWVATANPKLGFASQSAPTKSTELTADDWYLKAVNQFKKSDLRGALIAFDKSIALQPRYSTYHDRGVVYDALKDYDNAIANFDKAIELKPKYGQAYINRGVAYGNLKRYRQAIADFDQAIALKPQQVAYAYDNRGLAYSHLKENQKAIADFDQALALEPNYEFAYKTYTHRGVGHYRLKAYKKAVADFGQAIALNPDYAHPYHGRAKAYTGLQEFEKAIRDHSQAITLKSDYSDAYNRRGILYHRFKAYKKAVADFDRVIALRPKDPQPYNNRAYSHGRLKNYAQAMADYSQAIVLNPQNAIAYYFRGRIHLFQDRKAQAKQDLQRAASLFKQQNNAKRYEETLKYLQQL